MRSMTVASLPPIVRFRRVPKISAILSWAFSPRTCPVDNKLALNAGWDLEMLSLEIGELGEAGFDLSLTGFDEFELGELFAERTQGRTDPDDALVLVATAVSTITMPLSGFISDRIGRKRLYLIGAVAVGIWGFVYFAMLNTAVPGWIFLAIVVSLIPHDMMYGPQGALIAECFSPRLRYSGSSLGFHLASLIAGGPAPLIATALLASTGSGYSVAIYIFMCAIVSVTATTFLPDYTNR